MTRQALALAALALVAFPASGSADVVKTKDGLTLEGTVVRSPDGSLVVTTEGGEVRLAADAVASVTGGEGPRAAARREMAAIAKDDAVGHYKMALALEAKGLSDVARDEYAAVVAADPEHPAARRALGYQKVDGRWLTAAEANRKNGLVLYGGQWRLPAEVDRLAKGPRRVAPSDAELVVAMKTAATADAALARAALVRIARAAPADRAEAATALLANQDPNVRRWACREIASLGDQSGLRTLIAVAVRDPHPEVRVAAVKAAATFGEDEVAIPFVRALGSEHPSIVANSARALATLGDARSIGYIVKKISGHGSSPRSYFASEEQISYIRDFDVEVAQTSFIADPIVGTLQQGAVQDVQVLDASIEQTIVERVLLDSFNSLAGTSLKDASQVSAWWKDHASAYKDFPPSAKRAAASKDAAGVR
jgi:hypothetical protein